LSDDVLVWGIFWLIIGLVFAFGAMAVKASRERRQQKLLALGGGGAPAESFWVGEYIAGLPNNTIHLGTTCVVAPDDLVFLDAESAELGRIPRDAVAEVIVEDKTKVTQRLTVTRIATLGVFSLAAPKKQQHPEFCLVVDWEDDKGVRQNTVFKFLGQAGANTAANKLRAALKPKTERLRQDEQRCPYCAEIIKKEAKLCKHCRSEL